SAQGVVEGPARAGAREVVPDFVVAGALTNIAKHAAATRAEIAVTRSARMLHVRVRDDGRGGALVRRDGFSTGLAGLTDRVRATGGVLELARPPGGGRELRAAIPLTSGTSAARAPARHTTEEPVRRGSGSPTP